MIRNEGEYKMALQRLAEDDQFATAQMQAFLATELTADEVDRAMQPTRTFHAQLREEIEWYERVKRRDFGALQNLAGFGRLLIALRIANEISQRELAMRLGVSEAQVSRDERNEYHGITMERAQRILDALDERLSSSVEQKPLQTVA